MSIEKINQGDQLSQSADLVNDNIDKLKMLFPEIVTEGRIDFKVLQQVLGEELEEEEEYYRFTWAGKSQARREAHKPSTGTLRPAKEESLDWDTTQNMYIEGDNLEVLKLMQKSYAGKIKMIYIDPPYNTGKDFVYKDNYKDNLKNYQEVTGQIDSDGNKTSTNSDSDGRYHSNWLNMMYPRLRLARNLLKDDGLIFMSIDYHEVDNLIKLSNDVFGEGNRLGIISNVNNPKGRSDDKFIATSNEFLLAYSKDTNRAKTFGFEPDEKITKRYNKLDSHGKKYREMDLRKTGDADRRIDRPDMFYYFYYNQKGNELKVSKEKLVLPEAIEIIPLKDDGSEGRWRWGFDTALKKTGTVYPKFMPNRKIWGIVEMDYLDGRPPVKSTSTWTFKDVNSERGSEQMIDLGFDKETFSRPKPIGTIKRVLDIGIDIEESPLVLDFFSGSCVISQAIFEFNIEKESKVKFIAIQLPEKVDEKSIAYEEGFNKITEIGKERIRRSAKKIAEKNPEKSKEIDLGFKVFKLDSSNIKSWDGNPENLNESLFDAVGNIKTDRTEEDVLYEILLKYGLDLTLPIEERIIEGKKVFNVGLGSLFICLADDTTAKVAEGIGQWKEECSPEICRVIFKDNGFTDVEKTNSVQTLKRYGINEIRSI